MPAGIKYNLNTDKAIEEVCRFETVYRMSGGFNLDDSDLPEGAVLPVLIPLAIDLTTRKAKAVKNVTVAVDTAAADTTIKVNKGSLVAVNMFIGTGSKGAKVTAIDKTSENYDVLTLDAALDVVVKKGQVLFEASAAGGTTPKNIANFLNYARTKVEPGATVTAVARAYEIVESKLTSPISAKDKASLGDNFIYIP